MSDTLADTADELRRAAAAAIIALPGVVRLEPTLSNALRRLHTATVAKAATGNETTYSAADGIRLTRRGDLIDIHVDITITTTPAANLTAETVRDTLRSAIVAYRLLPGEVTVTVLKLQPVPLTERQ